MKQRFKSLDEYINENSQAVNESILHIKIKNINDVVRLIENQKQYKVVKDESSADETRVLVRASGNTNLSDRLFMQTMHTNGLVIEGDIESGEFYVTYDNVKLDESNQTNEAEVNLDNKYALVIIGGSIGGKSEYPIFVGRDHGDIIETSDDKDALAETKKRRNSQLTPGEKSYYGMKYKVIEITNSVKKTIAYLKDYQNKAEDTTVSESSLTDWIQPGVPINIMNMYGIITAITKEMNTNVYEFEFVNLDGEKHTAMKVGDRFLLKESEDVNEGALSPEMAAAFHAQYDDIIKKNKIEVRGEPITSMGYGKFALPIFTYNIIKNNTVIGSRLTKVEADASIDIIKNMFAWENPTVVVSKDTSFINTDQLEALKKQK